MNLTKLAVLLSGAALSASALAAPIGDENDTSWLTPQSKPLFSASNVATADRVGLPNDLDENALAYGNATHGTSKRILAGASQDRSRM